MKTIYKYELTTTEIVMPKNSQFLCVQLQRDIPCLWAVVDTDVEEKETVKIRIVPTGHTVPNSCVYIGTYQIVHMNLVFHVFRESNNVTG